MQLEDRGSIDLSDIEFWVKPLSEREAAFAWLREHEPIRFFEEPEPESFPRGPGYWALTRHEHLVEASRNPELFCSGQGTNIPDFPPEFLEFFGSMINMDDPRHARMRRIVSRGFTPKKLDELKGNVERAAREVVDEIIERGECDFVTEVAALLPLRIIVDMMGIPRSEEQFIFERSNIILGATDTEYVADQSEASFVAAILMAGQDLAAMVQALGEERMRAPQNDMITALVTADVEGEHLTPQELASFFILLVVAGNETTRNAIAHGLVALTDHPDEKQRWIGDFDGMAPTAVEEIVRWATPVIHFRRTVTEDGARIGGHEFAAGDKVVLFYNSANRDEAVFDEPDRFNVARQPNEHVGFGGPGPHFCLGSHLARREITVVFRELFRRMPDLHASAPPARLRSSFIHGIKHLPAAWEPRSRTG